MPRLQDGIEHTERALAERVQLHLEAGVAFDGLHQQVVRSAGVRASQCGSSRPWQITR
jgi:hypothetical protein